MLSLVLFFAGGLLAEKAGVRGAWGQLAREGESPADPVDGFTILVAEKHVHHDQLVFLAHRYRWKDYNGWERLDERPRSLASAAGDCSVSIDAPMHEISERWSHFCEAVRSENEMAYAKWLSKNEATKLLTFEDQESAADSLAIGTAQIAALLPGPSVVKTA